MATYSYRGLSHEKSSIRLLRLLPSVEQVDQVQCEILHDDVQNLENPYEALSYTWGDVTQTNTILIKSTEADDSTLAVTVNLNAALIALRRKTEPRVLWIDAICINQNDVKEQSEQVRFMWDIYHTADSTVIWLGPEARDSAIAMDNFAKQECQRRLIARSTWRDHPKNNQKCGCHAGNFDTYPPRVGIQGLIQRDWFTRVWVLQEVAAAKHVQVICGDRSVDGDTFYREVHAVASFVKTFGKILREIRPALELLNKNPLPTDAKLLAGAQWMERTYAIGSTFAANSTEESFADLSLPLIELTERFRNWNATRPVDKIYSLLRISSDAVDVSGLRPDYSLSDRDVARSLIKFAFPQSIVHQSPNSDDEVIFEVEAILLGSLQGESRIGTTRFWPFEAADSCVPDASYKLAIKKLFTKGWTIRITNERRLQRDSAVILIRGAQRPTILEYKEGKPTVSLLAAPEPVVRNDEDAAFVREGWSSTLCSLQELFADSEGVVKLTLSWDPFRKLSPSQATRYTPRLNSVDTQWEAHLQLLADAAELEGNDRHDCHAISTLWAMCHQDSEAIEAGTSQLTVTLHMAAYKGYLGTVKLLLDAGAPVNNLDKSGSFAPIHMAAVQGHARVVQALLEANADVDVKDSDNVTALQHAATEGKFDVARVLLEGGANPNLLGEIKNWLLFTSATHGQLQVVEGLLKAGVDANLSVSLGSAMELTALHAASEQGYPEIVTVLLAAGANIDRSSESILTPLHLGAQHGQVDIVKILLAAGADVNSLDVDGATPLDYAVYYKREGAMNLLLQHGGLQLKPNGN